MQIYLIIYCGKTICVLIKVKVKIKMTFSLISKNIVLLLHHQKRSNNN
nr:MAG TPA: hypothetical protein [Caudoviricetes sp.]